MTDKEKLEKLKKLADKMYYAAQYLTTDASRLRKTMEDYHQFIVQEWHKEEPVSEDMWEASKQYALRQVFASTDTEMCEQAYLDLRLFSGLELAIAHKDGAQWQKEQEYTCYEEAFEDGASWKKEEMMKGAIDATVHIDAGNYPYIPQMELYDYDKDVPLAKEGDKYKVVLIKEE